jgi:hypothetical protein
MYNAGVSTKDMLPFEVVKELIKFHFEDAGNQFRSIIGNLAGKEVFEDLTPSRVGRKGDKESRLTEGARDSHGILHR